MESIIDKLVFIEIIESVVWKADANAGAKIMNLGM